MGKFLSNIFQWKTFTSLWDDSGFFYWCARKTREIFPTGVSYTAKHFLIGGRSFVHNIIHLPVLRLKQPIATQQERKMFFSRELSTHLLFSPSTVNWVALFKTLNQVFQFSSLFVPFSLFFPSFFPFFSTTHRASVFKASASRGAKNSRWWKFSLFGWEKRKKKRGNIFLSNIEKKASDALVKNITMIMIDDET